MYKLKTTCDYVKFCIKRAVSFIFMRKVVSFCLRYEPWNRCFHAALVEMAHSTPIWMGGWMALKLRLMMTTYVSKYIHFVRHIICTNEILV